MRLLRVSPQLLFERAERESYKALVAILGRKPRLLDTYCCEGGASVGYHRAGFEVTGVDIFEKFNQQRYPFPSYLADAVEFIQLRGHEYDVIVGSPPCQAHSRGTVALRRQGKMVYEHFIPATREAMRGTGKPYIIENVNDARKELIDPVELCGCMWKMGARDADGVWLHLQRIRLFESNMPLHAPRPHNATQDHAHHEWVGGSYGGARRDKYEAKYVRMGGYVPSIPVQQKLLGIDWMTQNGMFQSIPPIFTEYLGIQVIEHMLKELTA